MTSEDFIAYQQWLLQTDLGPSQRGIHRRSARLFWVFRAGLHTDRLSLDPQRLHSWQIDNCQPPRRIENATDRVPEEVISPLLVWALRWVNDFSDDVLAARDEWWLLYLARPPEKGRKATGEKLPSKLAALQRLLRRLPPICDARCQPTLTARSIGISLPGNYAARTASSADRKAER